MNIEDFKEYVKTKQALDTEEIHRFMDEMSDEARHVTFRLNTAYHTPDEVRDMLSEVFGYQVPQSLRVFHRSTPISARTSSSASMCLSMPAAIFKTTAA